MKSTIYFRLLIGIFLVASFSATSAQAPLGFNYQAVARSSDNTLLTKTDLVIHFSIIKFNDQVIWKETRNITTDELGLFSVDLCNSNEYKTGGTLSSPEKINWGYSKLYLKVDIDYKNESHSLPKQIILSVPYAINALNAINDDDRDPENEIQDLQLTGTSLKITNNSNPSIIDLSFLQDEFVDADNQQLVLKKDTLSITNGNSIKLSALIDSIENFDESDPDPTNELQTITFEDRTLSLSDGGGSVYIVDETEDADADPNNELQSIAFEDRTLSLSDGGGSVYIADDTIDADADPNNEIQDLIFSAGKISLSNDPNPTTIELDNRIKLVSGWNKYYDTVYTFSNIGIGTYAPGGSELAVQGFDLNSEEPLFEVKRKDGVPVFAVYNDGVMVFVDETSKGIKGGFAVGGYNSASKGITQEYLRVTDDSVRIWVRDDDTAVKGLKGGFAVGGYSSATKGITKEFLRVTDDSTRVYVDQGTAKGLKGGFAVGGYGTSKNSANSFMSLTPENYFIGHESGTSITTGTMNSFFGYQSGISNTTGSHNVFMGPSTGEQNNSGAYNVIIGSSAGQFNNGDYNVFIGYQSGRNNVGGADTRFSKYNTFIGYQSGFMNSTGWHNIAIGFQAGYNNQTATNQFFIGNNAGATLTDGYGNTFVGHSTGKVCTDVSNNTFVGYYAGSSNITGDNNTYIGYAAASGATGNDNVIIGDRAGHDIVGNDNTIIGAAAGFTSTGAGNVFIGKYAGYNETGDNNLYIDNSNTSAPLIYGDFSSDSLVINGSLSVRDLSPTTSGLYVRYNTTTNMLYYYSSSRSTKDNITPLEDDFNKILDADPVSFIDKTTGESHIGYIAEEFEDLGLENLVIYVDGKPAALSYELISLYNLEIIKDQQTSIRQKNARISELEERLNKIEKLLGLKE